MVDTKIPGKVIRWWYDSHGIVKVDGVGGNTKTGQYNFGTPESGARYDQIRATQPDTTLDTCTLSADQVATYSGCNVDNPASFSCTSGTSDGTSESYSPLNDCHFFSDKFQDFIVNELQVTPWFPGTNSQIKFGMVVCFDFFIPPFLFLELLSKKKAIAPRSTLSVCLST